MNEKQQLIFDEISKFPKGLTRSDLVNRLNMPRSTIYDSLVKLMRLGLVEKVQWSHESDGPGRKYILFRKKILEQK